ncbi:MAG: hypothetical protein M3153_03140 [Chloroflexota bacterium]|nr:hypothetical protein [Chloroflexota bacterium]
MRWLAATALVLTMSGCGSLNSASPVAAPACVPPADLGTGIEGLQAYGADRPDEFGGMYIDPPGGEHVIMLFTANLDQHACAVEAIQPGTTLRAVDHTEAELQSVIESIDYETLQASGIEMLSASVDVIANRATLEAKSEDPTAEARLELSFGGLVDVTIHPVPGPWHHTDDGEGWRLLAAGEGGLEAYTVLAATDAAGYEALWRVAALPGVAPDVDLDSEVVVAFGHGIGIGCREVRLDDVAIGADTVWSVTSDPLQPRNCDAALAGTYVMVVAVGREVVPDGFTLWLNEYAASRGGDFSDPLDVALP